MVSKQRAMVKALAAGGLKGDLRKIITLFNWLGYQADEPGEADSEATAADRDIVESFAGRKSASAMASADESPPIASPPPF